MHVGGRDCLDLFNSGANGASGIFTTGVGGCCHSSLLIAVVKPGSSVKPGNAAAKAAGSRSLAKSRRWYSANSVGWAVRRR